MLRQLWGVRPFDDPRQLTANDQNRWDEKAGLRTGCGVLSRGDYKFRSAAVPADFDFISPTSRNENPNRPRLAPKDGANLGHRAPRDRKPVDTADIVREMIF